MGLPRFLRAVQGPAELGAVIREVAERLGCSAPLVVSGPTRSAEVAADIPVRASRMTVAGNSAADVRQVLDELRRSGADVVVAVGGGRPLDVAKSACIDGDTPVVTCPTQLTADGIASPVSVIAGDDGTIGSRPGRLPAAVVCDLALAAAAPADAARAGVGDLIANVTAVRDWELAAAAGAEEVDDFAALLARSGADLVLSADLSSLRDGDIEVELVRRLLEGLVLSGLAMAVAGSSRPCSGAEHLVSHALDRVAPRTARHGEQVAFGALVVAHLQGGDWRTLRRSMLAAGMDRATRGFDLPREELLEAIRTAPGTRPDRRTVLDSARDGVERALDEVLAA